MSFVTLQGFVPSPRDDGIPWTKAYVQEAPAKAGPWTVIEGLTLNPVDSDPQNPMPRSFSFSGTLDSGWYRVRFTDTGGTQEEFSSPVHNISNYVPQVSQVAALLRTRTKDTSGNVVGTFNTFTRPTYDEVLELIAQAVGTLSLKIGAAVPDVLIDEAARVAALRAAMLVELSFFPEAVQTGRSPYAMYDEMWKEAYGDGGKNTGALVQAVTQANQNPANEVLATSPGLSYFSFPVADNIGTRIM